LEAAVRLYLDENLSPRIALQLRYRGIDAVSARDLGKLGDDDLSHLERSSRMGRVLVTADVDFLRLASAGIHHRGIIFGNQQDHAIGDWVNELELLCFVLSPDELENHIEYL
jgi:predicted nuclease of predicted toxin-antitoxin system